MNEITNQDIAVVVLFEGTNPVNEFAFNTHGQDFRKIAAQFAQENGYTFGPVAPILTAVTPEVAPVEVSPSSETPAQPVDGTVVPTEVPDTKVEEVAPVQPEIITLDQQEIDSHPVLANAGFVAGDEVEVIHMPEGQTPFTPNPATYSANGSSDASAIA